MPDVVYLTVAFPDPTIYYVEIGESIASSSGRLITGKTALTGGGTLALDGIVTTTLSVNVTTALCVVSNIPSFWQLVTGTDAENVANGIVRPDDYAASTNEKVWKQIS